MSLSIESLRVDGPHGPIVENISFTSAEPRVLFTGMPREVGEAIAGLRTAASGSVFFGGRSAPDLFRSGEARYVALDAPLPEAFTVATYLAWAARLGEAARKPTADEALRRFHLEASGREPIASLARPLRRALSLAGAFVSGARILVMEDPTARWVISVETTKPGLFQKKPKVEVPFSAAFEQSIAKAVDEAFGEHRVYVLSTNEQSPLRAHGFSPYRYVRGIVTPLVSDGAPEGHLVSVARNIDALSVRLQEACRRDSLHTLIVDPSVSPAELFRHALACDALLSEIAPLGAAGRSQELQLPAVSAPPVPVERSAS